MTPEGGNSSSGELESLRHQLRVVTEVANQLAERLFAVEARLAQVERGGMAAPVAAPPRFSPPPTGPIPLPDSTPEVRSPEAEPPTPPPLPPAPLPPPASGNIESQVGLTLINRIGVITLIIGVAYAFKVLADNGYIGAGGRVITGVLAGALSLYAGDFLWHRGQRIFAQGITSLGIGILYLSFYAAFDYYALIPQSVAMVLMIVTTTAAGALALRYDARAIAILALFGGYATPVMLSNRTPNDLFFAAYMIVLNAVGLWVARQRKWLVVESLALVATFGLEGFWIADRHRQIGRWLLVASTLIQYGLFASGPLWVVAALAQVAAAIGIASVSWDPLVQLALEAAGLAIFFWRRWSFGPPAVFLAWWIGYAIGVPSNGYWGSRALFAAGYCTVAFLILMAYPVVAARLRRRMPEVPVLATLAINGLAYFAVVHQLLVKDYADYMGLLAVVVAALYLLAGWLIWNSPSEDGQQQRDSRTPILAAGMALAFLALAVPIQFTGYRVAIAWAIQAAALGFIAWKMPSAKVLIGAAAVAVLAIGDLRVGVEYTTADYRPLMNSGFVTMVVVAVSLWLLAYFVVRTRAVTRDVPEWAPGPPYVVGHLVFLTGLHFEIFQYLDWTGHTWQSKVLASTVLLALYGIGLLLIGIRTRTVINRVMGLVLFVIVILKLYFSDVWMFDVIFKMIAFLALGGLLVAGSYLYSRYRNRIETLWKKDDATTA